jgi:hypothetical protein
MDGMVMSIEPMILTEGQLGNSLDVLYRVPPGRVTYIKTIALSNLGSEENAVSLFIKKGSGGLRRIYHETLAGDETERVTDPIALSGGDWVYGLATRADLVDYAVFGAEEIMLTSEATFSLRFSNYLMDAIVLEPFVEIDTSYDVAELVIGEDVSFHLVESAEEE